MGIAVAALARQAQGITAVNAKKHLRENVVVFMSASYLLPHPIPSNLTALNRSPANYVRDSKGKIAS
jgi:hypothetical protein